MASAISHFVVGAGLALPALRSASIRQTLPAWAIPLISGILAAAPDLDTFLMSALDIPYNSVLGHRGLLHSALFLVIVNSLLALAAAHGASPAGRLVVLLRAIPSAHGHAHGRRPRSHALVPFLGASAILRMATHSRITSRCQAVLCPRRLHSEIRSAVRSGSLDDRPGRMARQRTPYFFRISRTRSIGIASAVPNRDLIVVARRSEL